ncbi:porin [Robbsia sp. KACC 23696]|uniref:porin n=1 Tax=Robbsia sp. KACC 23696 TaxID=3149231 RepID=UPI00325BF152
MNYCKRSAVRPALWSAALALSFVGLSAVGTARAADSTVTLYGSIDEGITYISNQAGKRAWTMGVVAVPDKFGLKGTEDLGGGLSAIFQLENGYFSNTGTSAIAADAFSRYAWVGLSSVRSGTLTLGRQWDLTNDVFTPNANGAVQYNNYLYHPANFDNSAVNDVNNSLRYTSPKWGGWFVQGMYGFSDHSSGQGRYAGATLRYAAGPLSIGAVYSSINNRTYALNTLLGYTQFLGQTLTNGNVFRATNTTVLGVGGQYRFSPAWTLHGLADHVHLETAGPSGNIYNVELGLDWLVTPFNSISLGGFRAGVVGRQYTSVGLADLYHFSATTMVYAEATTQFASHGTEAAMPSLTASSNTRQTTLRIGVQHYF